MAKAGWVGLGVFLLIAFITKYTALLIGRITAKRPDLNSFARMGRASFGTIGEVWIVGSFFFEILLAGVGTFTLLSGDQLHKLYPAISSRLFSVFFVLASLPTTWLPNLKALSYVSTFGFISSLVLFGTVLYFGIHLSGNGPGEGGITPIAPTSVINWSSLPFSFGLFVAGFAGHVVIPNIYGSMKQKARFNSMLNTSYVFCLAMYGTMAVIGYMMYGVYVQKEITLNLPSGTLSDLCLWLIVVNRFSKFALAVEPAAEVLDETIGSIRTACERRTMRRRQSALVNDSLLLNSVYEPPSSGVAEVDPVPATWLDHPSEEAEEVPQLTGAKSSRKHWFWILFLRACISAIAAVIGAFLPYMDKILAFAGSLFTFSVSIIFPCLVYLKLFWTEVSTFAKCCNFFIIAFGILAAVLGVVGSVTGDL